MFGKLWWFAFGKGGFVFAPNHMQASIFDGAHARPVADAGFLNNLTRQDDAPHTEP